MDISKKCYVVDGYQVLSDEGFIDIENVILTIPLQEYIIYFTSGKVLRCADNHVVIDIEGDEIFAKNLSEGDLILSDNIYDEVFDVVDTGNKINMYDLNLNKHHLFYTNGILSHNSNSMANFAARQLLHGKNVVLMTLEMSQDSFAQRFDSILSLMNINRMYMGDNKSKLVKALGDIKKTEGIGEVYVKEFPTGAATVNDFRVYLRELQIRGIQPDILYADYINLMKTASKTDTNMYNIVKRVAEELRALSFEFKVPVVSVTQLNREGMFVGFEQLDFTYLAECLDLNTLVDKLYNGVCIKEKLMNIKNGDIIKNNNGWVVVKRTFDVKKKKMYKVKTKNGKELICSGDHKFPTNKGELSIKKGLSIGHKLNTK